MNNDIKNITKEMNIVSNKMRVLCVDDEQFNLEILNKHITKAGYDVVLAENGEEALVKLKDSVKDSGKKIDVVLLDRMMPGISGIEVLKQVKANPLLVDIPVIMQTAAIGSEEAVEGIDAGAYYYVTKPYSSRVLLSIVASALSDAKQSRELRMKIAQQDVVSALSNRGEFEFRTPKEAREVALHLASFSKNPSRAVIGLTALIGNAIEHGSLEIGYEKKNELLISGKWEEEIDRRLSLPEYENRKVRVSYAKDDDEVRIYIKDEGKGFDWEEFMDFEPVRMTNSNGRGIAMTNVMCPNSIEFRGNGSEVVYTIRF